MSGFSNGFTYAPSAGFGPAYAPTMEPSAPAPVLSFSDIGLPAAMVVRPNRKLMSAAFAEQYKELADNMQIRCEDGCLLLFTGVRVYKYWTDYPKSLAIVLAVPESQFADEFKNQFGPRTCELFQQHIKSLPFNFPIVPRQKLPDGFPDGHVPVKLRLSAGMLEKFRDKREDGVQYKKDAVWDMYVVPTVYHSNQEIQVPGISLRLQRLDSRPSR
jgi:hypothetical protein